jgi:DNA invertase Pin-like site-specific DNA recombinase
MTQVWGYTRELLVPGDTDEDVEALRAAGTARVFVDRLVARPSARRELSACIDALAPGGLLVIPSAVRLSHSVDHFVLTVARLRGQGVSLLCLTEPELSVSADVSGAASGDVIDALDRLRSRLVSLRTRHGLDAAAAAGRRPGRPRVMTEEKTAVAGELRAQGRSFAHIGHVLGVSEAAVRRALNTSLARQDHMDAR